MKHDYIQHQVYKSLREFKENIAIEYGSISISYEELDRKSNFIANWIMNKGIEPQTFIGILVDDRIHFILTMIGILKANCVFVPLDSAIPQKRLETMLKSTDTGLVIADETNINRFKSNDLNTDTYAYPEFILLDDLFLSGDHRQTWFEKEPDIRYSPEDQIYIYFTSGTTGIPNAFVGKNKSLLHFINWEIDTFAVNETFRFSQLTTPGFDAFLRDVFVPLCSGGVVCFPESKDILLDSPRLTQWVERSRIHLIHCVPSLFRMLNPEGLAEESFKELKFILLSGEKIEPPDLVSWYKRFHERIRLVNLWGTSETTLAKTYYFIREADATRERIPVGKPMRGARVIILDERMNVCNDMMTGEIYIRTPYRTFGYYNDQKLNKERFIQNPFSESPGDLIHKTGDLGRFLSDGNIELIGRADRQVKIRGIRVELEEIENVLCQHPAVKEAVVVKKELSKNNELLSAFITEIKENLPAQNQEETLTSNLREYLSRNLPDYMVPAHIVKLEKIPRTLNGKINYQALEDIPVFEGDYQPPRNELQKKILQIWWEIFGIEMIGINRNFFELGGNSLKVMSLITKIHRKFNIRISLGEIFNNNTIEKQAKIVQKTKKEAHVSIEAREKKKYHVMSSAQKRLYIIQQMDKASIAYNLPLAVEIEGDLEKKRLAISFRKLIDRHDSLRTSFLMLDNEPVQRIHHPQELEFALEYDEVGEAEAAEMVKNYIRPFDLSEAPLLRAGIIKIQEKRYILEIDMHHIISDAVSNQVLINDFMVFYGGKALPALRLQYKDYSEWQSMLIASGKILDQEKYWLKQFEEEMPLLNLPLDYPRPTGPVFEGQQIYFELDQQLTGAINELVLETGTTVNIVLMAVYILLLSKYSGQEDIVLGFAIAGRTHADLDNVVGMFVNMIAMRSRPLGNQSFIQFTRELKENSLKAYENQDYQFEELVNKLRIQRYVGRNPLFDVVFNFLDFRETGTNLPDLKLKPYSFKFNHAQFDLILTAFQFKEKIGMRLEYLSALFKPSTIQQISRHYMEILEQLMENKNIKLKDISISHEMALAISTLNREEVSDFSF